MKPVPKLTVVVAAEGLAVVVDTAAVVVVGVHTNVRRHSEAHHFTVPKVSLVVVAAPSATTDVPLGHGMHAQGQGGRSSILHSTFCLTLTSSVSPLPDVSFIGLKERGSKLKGRHFERPHCRRAITRFTP